MGGFRATLDMMKGINKIVIKSPFFRTQGAKLTIYWLLYQLKHPARGCRGDSFDKEERPIDYTGAGPNNLFGVNLAQSSQTAGSSIAGKISPFFDSSRFPVGLSGY